MRFTASVAAAILAYTTTVSAHTWVYSVWVNGEDQGDGRGLYIRSPTSNSPVKDLSSPNLVCNDQGGKKVDNFVTAAAGDTVSLEWYHDYRNDNIIDTSHKGPVITYIAEYTEGDGTGAIWTKIDESGYDGSSWAVDKLIANKGLYDVTIPDGLAAGKYLLRQEIIALHESDTAYTSDSARGAQFYPSCIQLEVTGSGSAVPDQAFDFNSGYTYSDPGIVFNLYGSYSSYDIPGPEVWSASGAGSGSGSSPAPAPTTTAAPIATTTAAPVDSAPTTSAPAAAPTAPSTGCSARRRKRSQRKH